MINRFSQFLVEEEKTVFLTMGRFNPPTMGHGMLLDKVSKAAGKNPYRIFVSQSNDQKKNPLTYKDKIKFVRKMFPKHARSVMMDTSVKTPIDAAVKLYDEGYKNIVMLADADQTRKYEALLNRYNGKEARHGFYNFNSMKFVSQRIRSCNIRHLQHRQSSPSNHNFHCSQRCCRNRHFSFGQSMV